MNDYPQKDKSMEDLLQFKNSQEFTALRRLYESPTLFNILGIERKENRHSDFLKWLLDPRASHGMEDRPLRRFLDLILLCTQGPGRPRQQEDLPHELYSRIVSGDYRVVQTLEVERERPISCKYDGGGQPQGRIDLFCEYLIEEPNGDSNGNDKKKTPYNIAIILENKIDSAENITEGKGQTQHYFVWAKQNRNGENQYSFFVYLTPMRLSDYLSQNEAPCESDAFVHITYQHLLDRVLEPLQGDLGLSPEADILLNHYIRNLSYPALKDLNAKDISTRWLPLAVSQREHRVFRDIYEHHHEFLITNILEKLGDCDLDSSPVGQFYQTNKESILIMIAALLEHDAIAKKIGVESGTTEYLQLKGRDSVCFTEVLNMLIVRTQKTVSPVLTTLYRIFCSWLKENLCGEWLFDDKVDVRCIAIPCKLFDEIIRKPENAAFKKLKCQIWAERPYNQNLRITLEVSGPAGDTVSQQIAAEIRVFLVNTDIPRENIANLGSTNEDLGNSRKVLQQKIILPNFCSCKDDTYEFVNHKNVQTTLEDSVKRFCTALKCVEDWVENNLEQSLSRFRQ